jgi:hypothetical protein
LFHGPLGGLLRQLGGMPIDRSAAKGVVEQMIDQFRISVMRYGWALRRRARAKL